MGRRSLNKYYGDLIDSAEPSNAIAYFWPDPPLALVERAKARGLLTVREMINCYRGTAKVILDSAYENLGMNPGHGITQASVEQERKELSLYDYVFASSQVESSLSDAGVHSDRILPGGFGWSRSPSRREIGSEGIKSSGFKVLFVGTVCIRKGIPQLLEAWLKSGVTGELLIAGRIDEEIKPLVATSAGKSSITFLGYVPDVSKLYCAVDAFVFPTFEEGGPQVVYEAAGSGLPVITTPMGAGRIIKDRVNGLVVDAGNVDALADAIVQVATSEELRRRLSERALADATQFTYERIAAERATILVNVLRQRAGS